MACGNPIDTRDAALIAATALAAERGLPPGRYAADPVTLMALHAPEGSAPVDYDGAHEQALNVDGTVDQTRLGAAVESQWREQHEAAQQSHGNGVSITRLQCGSFTYLFDQHTGRPIGAYGTVQPPDGPRDYKAHNRQPSANDTRFERSERGHIIAHRLGGGTFPFNFFPQAFASNRGEGSQWAKAEAELEAAPGAFVAVRLMYQDGDERRPATFEMVRTTDTSYKHQVFSNAPAFFRSSDAEKQP